MAGKNWACQDPGGRAPWAEGPAGAKSAKQGARAACLSNQKMRASVVRVPRVAVCRRGRPDRVGSWAAPTLGQKPAGGGEERDHLTSAVERRVFLWEACGQGINLLCRVVHSDTASNSNNGHWCLQCNERYLSVTREASRDRAV